MVLRASALSASVIALGSYFDALMGRRRVDEYRRRLSASGTSKPADPDVFFVLTRQLFSGLCLYLLPVAWRCQA